MNIMYTQKTEIRHMSPHDIFNLSEILDQLHAWKKLMRVIPKIVSPPDFNSSGKYTNDHIQSIQNAVDRTKRLPGEILFEEWGSSGRTRPTIGCLLQILVKAELYRAADYVAINLLNEPAPKRPSKGPAASVDIALPLETQEIENIDRNLNDMSYPGSTNLQNGAKDISNMNNADFYTKLGPYQQKVVIEHSDLMKFSAITTDSSIRETIEQSSQQISSSQSLSNNNEIKIPSFESSNSVEQSISNIDLPNLSILNYTTDVDISTEDNIPRISCLLEHNNIIDNNIEIPNLSELNIEKDGNDTRNSNKHELNLPILSALNDLTSRAFEDMMTPTPDLSLSGQSNLDESSLTNVTATSESISSFENDVPNTESNSNIPCISMLQNSL